MAMNIVFEGPKGCLLEAGLVGQAEAEEHPDRVWGMCLLVSLLGAPHGQARRTGSCYCSNTCSSQHNEGMPLKVPLARPSREDNHPEETTKRTRAVRPASVKRKQRTTTTSSTRSRAKGDSNDKADEKTTSQTIYTIEPLNIAMLQDDASRREADSLRLGGCTAMLRECLYCFMKALKPREG